MVPGGVITDVPRGTTAGQILRDKGELAILLPQRSSGPDQQQAAAAAPDTVAGSRAATPAPLRLVNVNNQLVAEDTVLSDGDLVILARERIKI
jgi:molybdopterin converting factor small subunit